MSASAACTARSCFQVCLILHIIPDQIDNLRLAFLKSAWYCLAFAKLPTRALYGMYIKVGHRASFVLFYQNNDNILNLNISCCNLNILLNIWRLCRLRIFYSYLQQRVKHNLEIKLCQTHIDNYACILCFPVCIVQGQPKKQKAK